MDQKRILLLAGTLVVLLLAAWLSGFFAGAPSTVETPSFALDADKISSITIRKGSDVIVAERTADRAWHLKAPVEGDADTVTTSSMLSTIEDFQIESLVSTNLDRHGRFHVDSTQATYLKLGGEHTLELFIGKSGPDFQSKFVRLGDDDRVFRATGVPTVEASIDKWKEKLLWSYPKESIATVSVRTPDSSYELNKGEGGWVLEQDDSTLATDSSKVDRYLERLAIVRADGFHLDVDYATVLDSAAYSVEINRIDGSMSRLAIMNRDSDAAALEESSQDVIKFASYRVSQLAPEPTEILK
jgi:hypothetical protein